MQPLICFYTVELVRAFNLVNRTRTRRRVKRPSKRSAIIFTVGELRICCRFGCFIWLLITNLFYMIAIANLPSQACCTTKCYYPHRLLSQPLVAHMLPKRPMMARSLQSRLLSSACHLQKNAVQQGTRASQLLKYPLPIAHVRNISVGWRCRLGFLKSSLSMSRFFTRSTVTSMVPLAGMDRSRHGKNPLRGW